MIPYSSRSAVREWGGDGAVRNGTKQEWTSRRSVRSTVLVALYILQYFGAGRLLMSFPADRSNVR